MHKTSSKNQWRVLCADVPLVIFIFNLIYFFFSLANAWAGGHAPPWRTTRDNKTTTEKNDDKTWAQKNDAESKKDDDNPDHEKNNSQAEDSYTEREKKEAEKEAVRLVLLRYCCVTLSKIYVR